MTGAFSRAFSKEIHNEDGDNDDQLSIGFEAEVRGIFSIAADSSDEIYGKLSKGNFSLTVDANEKAVLSGGGDVIRFKAKGNIERINKAIGALGGKVGVGTLEVSGFVDANGRIRYKGAVRVPGVLSKYFGIGAKVYIKGSFNPLTSMASTPAGRTFIRAYSSSCKYKENNPCML
ncbi:MAG: hypothetical protein ACWA5R_13990 [bacterium]